MKKGYVLQNSQTFIRNIRSGSTTNDVGKAQVWKTESGVKKALEKETRFTAVHTDFFFGVLYRAPSIDDILNGDDDDKKINSGYWNLSKLRNRKDYFQSERAAQRHVEIEIAAAIKTLKKLIK